MREFQQKRRQRKLLYSRVSVAVLVIVLIFSIRAAWSVYGKERQSALLESQSAQRLAVLESQQSQLEADNSQLSTPSGVDRQIREDYHMIQPGEQLAVIVNEPTSTASAAGTGATAASGGFFSRLWQKVTGFF